MTRRWRRSARRVPGLPVGLSTSEAIERDPFARAAAVKSWRQPPDFVSVNLSELGWAGIARAARHAGIGVEAGLVTPADAEALTDSVLAHQALRALVEVAAGSRMPAPSPSSSPVASRSCGTYPASDR